MCRARDRGGLSALSPLRCPPIFLRCALNASQTAFLSSGLGRSAPSMLPLTRDLKRLLKLLCRASLDVSGTRAIASRPVTLTHENVSSVTVAGLRRIRTSPSEALLWKGESWRVPSVREKASMHCIPHAVLRNIRNTPDDVATRHSALGNSFHLPSFAMVLCILLSCVVQSTAFAPLPALCDPAECFIASRISRTVFHPGVCQSYPGCVSADDAALAFYKHCSSQGLGLGQCPSLSSQVS